MCLQCWGNRAIQTALKTEITTQATTIAILEEECITLQTQLDTVRLESAARIAELESQLEIAEAIQFMFSSAKDNRDS